MRKWLIVLGLALALHLPWRVWGTAVEAEWMKPAMPHLATANDAYWRVMALEARLIGLGYSVRYVPNLEYEGRAAYGLNNSATREIFIDQTLSWDARLAVLAHEGGHIFAPSWLSYSQADVFAEMVSVVVAGDSLREHARWLAGAKVDVLVVSLAAWPEIYHAAAVLSE